LLNVAGGSPPTIRSAKAQPVGALNVYSHAPPWTFRGGFLLPLPVSCFYQDETPAAGEERTCHRGYWWPSW